MTWVISDYVAAQGSAELSVQKGQQVEVIDTNCLGAPDYCLVRLTNGSTTNNVSTTSLSSSSTQEQIIQEGLVPSSILKPPPTQTTKSRRAGDGEDGELFIVPVHALFRVAMTICLLISFRCKYRGFPRATVIGESQFPRRERRENSDFWELANVFV